MSNDFVAIEVCPYCRKERGIAIQQNMKALPKCVSIDPKPCDKCIEDYKNRNILRIIEIKENTKYVEPTGRYIELPYQENMISVYPDHWAFCKEYDFTLMYNSIQKSQQKNDIVM